MKNYRRTASQLALMALAISLEVGAAAAEDPSLAVRMSTMEEQMRQLYGKVEQLQIEMLKLSEEMQRRGGAEVKASQAPESNVPALPDIAGEAPSAEAAETNDLYAYQTGELDQDSRDLDMITGGLQPAPGPKPLGIIPGGAAADTQGQAGIIQENAGSDAQGQTGIAPLDPGQPVVPEQVETASLDDSAAPAADTPEKLYELSYESLLRKRYGEAEAGFRSFVQKHPDHELAGNAEFWLGETYYVQSNYKAAAQAFLVGYQTYPTNRKAPDSLLKLGMALNQLGQKDQACAAFATIDAKFPKAAETRKRAHNESAKAGC
jgi:tol-pal system protein YbgF